MTRVRIVPPPHSARPSAAALGWLLVSLGGGTPARAQDAQAVQRVGMPDGLEFTIPQAMQRAPELRLQPHFELKPERAFSDDARAPLLLYIFRAPQPSRGLPENSQSVTHDYARGFASGLANALQLVEIYDVAPGLYDERRGAFSVDFKARSASRAHELLASSSATRVVGGGRTHCYLRQLLGGASAVSPAQLTARYASAARACGGSRASVAAFVRRLGPDAFSAQETSLHSVAFFTRSALVVALVVAPGERMADATELYRLIWSTATVEPTARLSIQPSRPTLRETRTGLGVQAARVLGAALAVLLLAGLVSRLLRKLRLSPDLSNPPTGDL